MEITIKLYENGQLDINPKSDMSVLELLGILEVAKATILTGERTEENEQATEEADQAKEVKGGE